MAHSHSLQSGGGFHRDRNFYNFVLSKCLSLAKAESFSWQSVGYCAVENILSQFNIVTHWISTADCCEYEWAFTRGRQLHYIKFSVISSKLNCPPLQQNTHFCEWPLKNRCWGYLQLHRAKKFVWYQTVVDTFVPHVRIQRWAQHLGRYGEIFKLYIVPYNICQWITKRWKMKQKVGL